MKEMQSFSGSNTSRNLLGNGTSSQVPDSQNLEVPNAQSSTTEQQFSRGMTTEERLKSSQSPLDNFLSDTSQLAPDTAEAVTDLAQHEAESSSGWSIAGGALKMVGGALETVAGGALVVTGAALSEIGIGIPIAAAGTLITAHGVDTTISGARTMYNGTEVDSLTSQGLQELGMSRTGANLTDAGISIAGSLGSGVVTRSPGVAAALEQAARSENSVSLAFRSASPLGHNMVGVNAGRGTQWSHLAVLSGNVRKGILKSGEAVIENVRRVPLGYSTLRVPVSASNAERASQATKLLDGTRSPYGYFTNDCATYARGVLREAGVRTLPVTSPALNYLATAAQSPEALRAMQPAVSALSTTATGVNVVVGGDVALKR